MSADRSNELIELLEKIVLQSGLELSENKNIPDHLPTIKAINRLNNYNMSDIANCNHRRLGAVRGGARHLRELRRAPGVRLAQICALHIIVNPDDLEDSS